MSAEATAEKDPLTMSGTESRDLRAASRSGSALHASSGAEQATQVTSRALSKLSVGQDNGSSSWSYRGCTGNAPAPRGCFHGCFAWIFEFLEPPKDYSEEQAYFERTVSFLTLVPLFKQQLPKSEIPKMARDMTRKVWREGEKLVKQGDVGRTFFLIMEGEASVVVTNPANNEECVRATLYPGDYFGGHSLVAERVNVADIVAKTHRLVTLSLSRQVFEESGLKTKLRFPKRPALHFDGPRAMNGAYTKTQGFMGPVLTTKEEPKQPAEEVFIKKALKKNANLRALLEAKDDTIHSIALAAKRIEVPAGTVVARAGELGQELFVIKEGEFQILADKMIERGQKSAETTVNQASTAERLIRKQAFMKELYRPIQVTQRRGNSVLANDPREGEAPSPTRVERGYARSASWNMKTQEASTAATTPAHKEGTRVMVLRHEAVSPKIGHPGWQYEIGTVVKSSNTAKGRPVLEVLFDGADLEPKTVDPFLVRPLPAEEDQVIGTMGPGESFGELSLIYNTFREATFKATVDSVVYAVGRRHFKAAFSRKGPRFKEYCALLDEVDALTPLLNAERWELACNAYGLFDYRPGQRILTQGKPRTAPLWYVIASGSCTLTREIKTADGQVRIEKVGEMERGGHFGERSLLRAMKSGGPPIAEINIDAGPLGVKCLAFEGEIIKVLLESLFSSGAEQAVNADGAPTRHHFLLNVDDTDVQEYEKSKCRKSGVRGGPQQMSCHMLDLTLDDLEFVHRLGSGGFATVDLVEDKKTQNRYALKMLSKGYVEQHDVVRLVCWERELLSMVDTPFVVKLYRTFKDEQFVYFLMEAVLGCSLYDVLHDHPQVFREDQPRGSSTAFYVACVIAAFEHLHERRIAYRDLKPENVLLDTKGYAKLCDMGFARFVLSKTNTLAGTPEYMAPEMIAFPHSHDLNVDWWALGVLTFEIISGQPPWEDEGVQDPRQKLLAISRSQERGEPRYPFTCPLMVKSFIGRLLKKLPGRLGAAGGAQEVRNHAWYQKSGFDFEALRRQTLKPPFVKAWSPFPRSESMRSTTAWSTGSDSPSSPIGRSKSDLFIVAKGKECKWDDVF